MRDDLPSERPKTMQIYPLANALRSKTSLSAASVKAIYSILQIGEDYKLQG